MRDFMRDFCHTSIIRSALIAVSSILILYYTVITRRLARLEIVCRLIPDREFESPPLRHISRAYWIRVALFSMASCFACALSGATSYRDKG